jgi:hypothetical protein
MSPIPFEGCSSFAATNHIYLTPLGYFGKSYGPNAVSDVTHGTRIARTHEVNGGDVRQRLAEDEYQDVYASSV